MTASSHDTLLPNIVIVVLDWLASYLRGVHVWTIYASEKILPAN